MAVDSRDKRFSIMGLGQPAPSLYGNPDGTIAAADRAQLLYLYSGLTLGVTALTADLAVTLGALTMVAAGTLSKWIQQADGSATWTEESVVSNAWTEQSTNNSTWTNQ